MHRQADAGSPVSTRNSDNLTRRAADAPAPEAAFGLDFRSRNEVFESPRDWRDLVIYQFMIDRFDDGGESSAYQPGDDLPFRDDPSNPDEGSRWQGGTLRGATRRLDYIKGLGAGAVWISPPLKARKGDGHGYHGYGIQDFLDIDPRFGTVADFVAFVKECHRREIWVIMDVVIDHAADVFGYADPEAVWTEDEQGNPTVWEIGGWREDSREGDESKPLSRDDAVWPRELQEPEAFKRKGPMRDVGEAQGAEAKDGDFMSLKVINLPNPRYMSAIINAYKYWIAVADVDGFRIDALRHVRHPAASDFIHAIREFTLSIGKKNFLQVGEVADSDEEMRRYVGSNVELLQSGEVDPGKDPDTTADYPNLDAVLDFENHNKMIPVVLGQQPASQLGDVWERRRTHYRDYGDSGKYYLIYLENHDLGGYDHRRLLNNTHDATPDGYDRPGGDPRLAVMATTILLCSLGIPCIYYGTEQGFDGGGDRDTWVREAMFGGSWGPFGTKGMSFFDDGHPIYRQVRRIVEIRNQEPALRYGRQYLRPTSFGGEHFELPEQAEPFAFARVLDVTEIVVVANPTMEAREVCVQLDAGLNHPGVRMRDLCGDGDWRGQVEQHGDGPAFVRLKLEARTAAVLRQSWE